MKQNPFSNSLFWMHITSQYLGRVEGKQFKLYLSLTMFRFLSSFLRASESAESASFSADFCSKTLFYSFYGRFFPELALNQQIFLCWLLSPNSVLLFLREAFLELAENQRISLADFCPKINIHFPISLTEKWHFGAKGLWVNYLGFSFFHYSIRQWVECLPMVQRF